MPMASASTAQAHKGSLRGEHSVGSRGKAPGQRVSVRSPPEAGEIFKMKGP